jgi:hypothetical protein
MERRILDGAFQRHGVRRDIRDRRCRGTSSRNFAPAPATSKGVPRRVLNPGYLLLAK